MICGTFCCEFGRALGILDPLLCCVSHPSQKRNEQVSTVASSFVLPLPAAREAVLLHVQVPC